VATTGIRPLKTGFHTALYQSLPYWQSKSLCVL